MEQQQPNKKEYQKPEIKEVDLRPEEAVLGNCKTGTTSGPSSGPSACSVPACSSIGS